MAWKQRLTEGMADFLRFCVRGALLVNAIMFAIGSIYLVAKLVWYSLQFLDRTLFAHPW